MMDLLITNGMVITMDRDRQVIKDGAVAIQDNRIVAVGPSEELSAQYTARRVIDAHRNVVMPGLIDGHGHAGHSLVKTMGAGDSSLWYQACEAIYTAGSTASFWYADAQLAAIERLKSGTTCGVSFLGGADNTLRTDDTEFADQHCRAVERVGIRAFLAVGPGRPPFPHPFVRWEGDMRHEIAVEFEDQLATCEALIQRWHRQGNQHIHVCLTSPTPKPDDAYLNDSIAQARAMRELSRRYGTRFTQDGHVQGSVKMAHEQFDFLGPDVFLSHCIDLTEEEVRICRDTETKVVHNPSANFSIMGRCPVPELLDAGVTVMLGSDGSAPNRSFDMFRHMFQCMHYHRTYHHDPRLLPPGKVLEMVTIEAARGLGLDDEIGSLESGKKADVILIDMAKPHLYPLNMPVFRLAYFANGSDVDTVIVDGQVVMEHRVVQTVNEADALELAQSETEAMLDRTQLRGLLEMPEHIWGQTRL
jgi:cytosine/adenosine deaminase-related metal-dependent hydrolase